MDEKKENIMQNHKYLCDSFKHFIKIKEFINMK